MVKLRFGLAVLVLLVVAISAFGADVQDSRLLQRISYDSNGQVRLHKVLEDVSAKYGVDIKCGKNDFDWRVRDIPLAISVKDMIFERFLILLAETAHVRFGKVENTAEKPIYRFYRNEQDEKDVYSANQNDGCIKLIL